MYIGRLASLTGSTPKAIRYYEQLGLLPLAKRKGSYRIYDDFDVQAVKMIRLAQAVGFSLAELQELSALKYEQKRFPIEMAKTLIAEKQQQILAQQQQLQCILANLHQLEHEITQAYQTTDMDDLETSRQA